MYYMFGNMVMVSDTSATSNVCSQPTSKQQWPGAMATEQANITEVCKCSNNSQVHSDRVQATDESFMSVRIFLRQQRHAQTNTRM